MRVRSATPATYGSGRTSQIGTDGTRGQSGYPVPLYIMSSRPMRYVKPSTHCIMLSALCVMVTGHRALCSLGIATDTRATCPSCVRRAYSQPPWSRTLIYYAQCASRDARAALCQVALSAGCPGPAYFLYTRASRACTTTGEGFRPSPAAGCGYMHHMHHARNDCGYKAMNSLQSACTTTAPRD